MIINLIVSGDHLKVSIGGFENVVDSGDLTVEDDASFPASFDIFQQRDQMFVTSALINSLIN